MDETSGGLYSLAAVNAQSRSKLGSIVLIKSPFYSAVTVLSAVIFIAVMLFFYFGSYTKKNNVKGEIVPLGGLVKIYANQSGRLVKSYLEEGKSIKRGDTLFLITSEAESATKGHTQQIISEQISKRLESLGTEKQKNLELMSRDGASLQDELSALQEESSKLNYLMQVQKGLVELAEQNEKRYLSLYEQDYIAKESWESKKIELLQQRSKLSAVLVEILNNKKNTKKKEHEIASLSLTYGTRIADIEKQIFAATEELARSEQQREVRIVSPRDGIATAISVFEGQPIVSSKPIANIVPESAEMQASLYAPSSSAGFVKPGDIVSLRYQAYPYQKFGKYPGKVVSVARTALPADEITAIPESIIGLVGHDQPLYKITVSIEKQAIVAYGVSHSLTSGMLVDAEIEQETRKIYEWIFEPLYTINGSF